MDTSCIILAGGKSLRLGHDKLFTTIGNEDLLQRVVSSVDSICSDIIIVTAEERELPQLTSHLKIRLVNDILPGMGSLGGIYTGLKTSDSLHNLVIGCDMPFLNQALLRYMFDISTGFDLVVPLVNNLLEPLHAVYAKSCLAPIESILDHDRKVIAELLSLVKVRYVGADEVDRFDPRHLSFFNINTGDDLDKARELARGEL